MEIFKIYNNIKELINTRQYKTNYKFDIKKEHILNHNFINIDCNNVNILFIINSESTIIKKSDVFLKHLNNLEKTHKNLEKIVIISKNKLSTNLKKKIKILKKNITIEILLFNIVIFDLTKHTNYINLNISKLNDDEKKNLFNLIDYDESFLNNICIDDPICIWNDFNIGDIIKFIKPSPKTSGLSVSYRLVINKNISINRIIINKHIIDTINEEEENEELSDKSDIIDEDDNDIASIIEDDIDIDEIEQHI
jgi:DNA-directed RNA polymerase subunit H (RpoH/RPB5)